MKIAKKSTHSADELMAGPSGAITAESYTARAVAFIRSRGGKGFVIRALEGAKGSLSTHEQPTEPQWIAWMAYFRMKEIPHRFALSHGMATVPAEWPEFFDYDAPVSSRNARLPQPPPPLSREKRDEMHQRMIALARSITVRFPKSKGFDMRNLSRDMAAAHLEKFKAEYTTTPCAPLSGSEPS